jgi:hypothetical protein
MKKESLIALTPFINAMKTSNFFADASDSISDRNNVG